MIHSALICGKVKLPHKMSPLLNMNDFILVSGRRVLRVETL